MNRLINIIQGESLNQASPRNLQYFADAFPYQSVKMHIELSMSCPKHILAVPLPKKGLHMEENLPSIYNIVSHPKNKYL